MPSELQLPACQKCKLRKVRCDRRAPKCTNCTRGAVACIIVDTVTGEQYARDYLWQLQEEEARLKEQLESSPAGALPAPTPRSEHVDSTQGDPSTETEDSMAGQSHFVGDGSGLGFLHSILSDQKWEQHRARIFSQLAARPRLQRQHLTPNSLPPLNEAEKLLENYFTRFHIHHTFLLRQEVLNLFSRIYSRSQQDGAPSAQDRFRLLMVFAISATTRHRAGLSTENPYGYFMAAEACLGSISLIKNIEAIQNLLLIARFGMYHHIGTSLWEISQLCMRQCIEWRLHVGQSDGLDPLTEQHRRRIFWECYVLDRYSSGILGRPFAIRECDITVQLPIDVDDAKLEASNAPTLTLVPFNTTSGPTELSVFIHCIRLRQISSRVHTEYFTNRGSESQWRNSVYSGTPLSRFKSIGHLFTSFSRFHTELRIWRSTMPIFPSPQSLYERAEWHDFLYEKDLMLLARGAMHHALSRSYTTSSVTKKILSACYESSSRVIQLYANLMDNQAITWTRSYFQVIFTAGLTIIYCVSLDLLDAVAGDEKHCETLTLCNNILGFFKVKMPDAESFAIVFDILKDECIEYRLHTGLQVRQPGPNTGNDISTVGPIIASDTTTLMDFNSYSVQPNLDSLGGSLYDSIFPYHVDPTHLGLGLNENFDLITQLEAGLCEYAWGWVPTDSDSHGLASFY
jgi:hypothetical protein